MPRLAVVALLLIGACACDAPWEGPTLPEGAHWIAVRAIASGPENCWISDALIAGPSVDQVEARVQAACAARGCNKTVGCWPGVIQPADGIFVAIYRNNAGCATTGKGGWAASPTALYAVYWEGRSGPSCGEAGMASAFVLYAVARSVLPNVRLLRVELQLQRPQYPTYTQDTEVDLG